MKLCFYSSKNKKPVQNFIESLKNLKAQDKILWTIGLLRDYGIKHLLQTQHLKKLKDLSLYELRIRSSRNIYRILFAIIKSDAYLLVAFQKKTQKTPKKYIKTALERKKLIEKNK